MSRPLRFIRSAADLLALMRESPSTRQAITTHKRDLAGRAVRAIADRVDLATPIVAVLAYIASGSEAERLFLDAVTADATPAATEAWARLPLRYAARYSACLLPEHPDAPRQPGGFSATLRRASMATAARSLLTRRRSL